jgi:PhnB protein
MDEGMRPKESAMQTELNPYLNFRNNARQAMEFYQSVFGGKLEITTYKQYQASTDPSEDDKVTHAVLRTEGGLTIMAADVPNRMEYTPGSNFSLSLSGEDEQQLRDYYQKLKDGGIETMPLTKAAWGDTFGMLRDRFGTSWLVNISQAASRETSQAA